MLSVTIQFQQNYVGAMVTHSGYHAVFNILTQT